MKRPRLRKTRVRPVRAPRSYSQRYSKAIKKHLRNLIAVIKTEVATVLSQDTTDKATTINSKLTELLETTIPVFIQSTRQAYTPVLSSLLSKITASFKLHTGYSVPFHSKQTNEIIGALLEENLELIKSIPQEVIQKSRDLLLNSIGSFDQQSIIRQLTQISQVSTRRMELIARDQVAKATERLSQARARDLSYKYYYWRTATDQRVSTGKGGHRALHNRIFAYDNPTAIIDSNGTRGIPSQRPNCRCFSIPVETDDDTKLILIKDKLHGDYYVIK